MVLKDIVERGEWKGYPYFIRHLFVGKSYYCGYVGISSIENSDKLTETEIYTLNEKYETLINCHGGITFSEAVKIDNSSIYLIGFDCNHYDDIDDPKDIDFVREECKSIIDQLIVNELEK